MQLATLGAVALVHEDEDLAHSRAGWASSSLMKASKSSTSLRPELVHQRAQQARCGLAKLTHQVAATAGALDGFARLVEDPLDLFIQLGRGR